jgi:hypothetical protein
MVGGPGIGKTTLWDETVSAAWRRGIRVLAAHSSGSDAQLPFAGLIDLCELIASDELAALPAPQRSVLEAALLRVEPRGTPAESTAIALGDLGSDFEQHRPRRRSGPPRHVQLWDARRSTNSAFRCITVEAPEARDRTPAQPRLWLTTSMLWPSGSSTNAA